MKHTLTPLLILALVGVANVQGQAGPPLGDDFIFFVEGVNTMVPETTGWLLTILPIPQTRSRNSHTELVIQCVPFSCRCRRGYVTKPEDGDVLHARIWVDPANAGTKNVQLLMEDKTDGSGADRRIS